MTIRERLSTIGQALTGRQPTTVETTAALPKQEKQALGGFLDFNNIVPSDETKVSSKFLNANKGWVYRNNDVIAKEVGAIEFELYRVSVVGQEVVYTPIVQHPLLDALDRFNEFTSASDGFYVTQSHRKLTGNCFWYIESAGLDIRNIFILPPDKVTIDLGETKGATRIIQTYTYKDTIKGKPINITYKPEEIIHFKVPNPNKLYRGIGAVEAAADAIDTDVMAIEANRLLFERGLISNFLLTTEKSLTDEQLKRFHAEFQRSYGGLRNAFRVPILTGGVEPKTIQLSNKDMEFIAQQEWVRDKIASIFGNSKAVLGVTDDVNRANAEATIMQWKRTTIRSEMKAITDTINEFLIPRYGSNLLLGFTDPVGEDEIAETDLVVKQKNAGIISLNEAREVLGLDPVLGGDEFNFQREDRLAQQGQNIPKAVQLTSYKKHLRRMGIHEKVVESQRLKEALRPIAKKIIKKQAQQRRKVSAAKTKQDTPYIWPSNRAKRYYHRQQAIIDAQEIKFRNKVEQFVNHLLDKALAQLPHEVADMQRKQLLDETALHAKAEIDLLPLLEETATLAGQEAMQEVGLTSVYVPAAVKQVMAERVKLFARTMIETDKNKLLDIIEQGIRQGQGIPDIRRQITDTFSTYTKTQAERISRTEISYASTQAATDAWKQSKVVGGKMWVTAGATDQCAPYDGKVKKLNQDFYSSDDPFTQGDPPLHPNCKCGLVPVLLEDMPGKSLGNLSISAKLQVEDEADEIEAKLKAAQESNKKLREQLKEKEKYIKEVEEYLSEN